MEGQQWHVDELKVQPWRKVSKVSVARAMSVRLLHCSFVQSLVDSLTPLLQTEL